VIRRHHVQRAAAKAAAPVGIIYDRDRAADTGAIWGQPMWGHRVGVGESAKCVTPTIALLILFLFLSWALSPCAEAVEDPAQAPADLTAVLGLVGLGLCCVPLLPPALFLAG